MCACCTSWRTAKCAVASEIGRDLGLDARLPEPHPAPLRNRRLAGTREPHPRDARQSLLRLTEAGHAAFAPLQQKSRDEAAVAARPARAGTARNSWSQAMGTMQSLLDPEAAPAKPQAAVLRDPAPGDIGWVVQQHGEIYAREYGWNNEFEALVAGIASEFLLKFQPEWERCWIAELNGERVGAIFVVRKSPTVAQLRMLILAPGARGLGPGGTPDGRVHRLRARQGLQEDGAVDQQLPGRGAGDLCQARVPADAVGAARGLWFAAGR